MSNGTGQSKAPYIILCGGRIHVLNSKDHKDKLQAASDAAVGLTSYYGKRVTAEQSTPISDLQHQMMDNFDVWSKTEAEQAVTDMFALLDALEEEMEAHTY